MRKLAIPFISFALIALSSYGCDESNPVEPSGSNSPGSFALAPTETSTTGVPVAVLGDASWPDYSRGGDINERGDVAGTCTPRGWLEACLWTHEGLTMLPDLAAAGETEAYAINNRGQAAGYSQDAPVIWEKGRATLLGTLGSDWGISYDINDLGQIVGVSGNEAGQERAFLWDKGEMTDLGTKDGDQVSYAWGINNRGQIVGYSYTSNVSYHALMWYKGQTIDLGTPPVGDYWLPGAINDRGQIVGSTNTGRALLWSDGEITDLGTLGGPSSSASDVSEQGRIVGSSQTAAGYQHAYLWDKGEMSDLGTLGGIRSYATGINSRGEVSGAAEDGSGHLLAVVWLPEIHEM